MIEPLTTSEALALQLLASGASRDDVSFALRVSATAVRDMLARILDTLRVDTRAEAISVWRGEQLHDALHAEQARRRAAEPIAE